MNNLDPLEQINAHNMPSVILNYGVVKEEMTHWV